MSRPSVFRWIALPIVVVVAAGLAVQLHRHGHTQGDDFALYLRQARSVFDGDMGAVIADNRFTVRLSDPLMGPVGYPWVWPLVLSPFVHQWGFDYDRLKLVEVGLLCVWLVLFHGIVRRRIGRAAAVAVTAVFATAPIYLAHTEQLLTEIPHLVAVALFIWWYDRIRREGATLLDASLGQLVALGGFVTLAFNVRRESVALLGVIAVMQVADLVRAGALPLDRSLGRRFVGRVRVHGRSLFAPYAAFLASAAIFHVLMPTTLLPNNDNELSYLDDRLGEYPATLADHLGLGAHTIAGVAVLGVAAVGAVIGIRRRPMLDGALLMVAVFSALAISTHLREVPRYWLQVTPWILYFVTAALVAAGQWLTAVTSRSSTASEAHDRRRHRVIQAVVLAPLAVLVVAHLVVLRGDIADVRSYNAAGRVLSGPSNPVVAPIFDAVSEHTPADSTIAYFRARTMTLLTDRRSFQTKNLERIALHADYFAQRRNSTYWQPTLTVSDARLRGWDEVWSDSAWILWKLPD